MHDTKKKRKKKKEKKVFKWKLLALPFSSYFSYKLKTQRQNKKEPKK